MFRYQKVFSLAAGLVMASAVLTSSFPVYADEQITDASEPVTETEPEQESKETEVYGDFSYSLNSDGTANIESYSGSGGEVDIPEAVDGHKVTELGKDSFVNIPTVESIDIPASVEYIAGENPFLNCVSLEEINVSPDNKNYCSEDGVLYSKDKTELMCWPSGKQGDEFTIPDGVKTLGIGAFCNTPLSSIVLNSGIEAIERHCFSESVKIESIDMSMTKVTYIDIMAFSYCEALSNVVFPESLEEIGGGAFAACKNLTEVDLPENLVTIGQNAFAGTGLKSVRIPDSVASISYCAFGYDENLKPVDGFVLIGESGSAAEVYASDYDEEYGYQNDFEFMTEDQYDMEQLYSDLEMKEYGEYMYAEVDGGAALITCTSVDEVIEVPAEIEGLKVIAIYPNCFYQSYANQIKLPDTLREIKERAICMCPNLGSLVVPDSVTDIGEQAFGGCTALTEITLPGGLTSLGDEILFGCTALKTINMSESGSGNYAVDDGVLYTKDKTALIAYPPAKDGKKYKAPSSLREISKSAFCGASNLKKVNISKVEKIGDYAFEDCTGLKKVILSEDLNTVGESAFYNCPELKSLNLFDKLENIGAAAFGYYYRSANETETENSYAVVDGFKVYTKEGTVGYNYASDQGMQIIQNSIYLFGYNIDPKLFYVLIGVVAMIAAAVITFLIRRRSARTKAERFGGEDKKKPEGGKETEIAGKKGKDEEEAESSESDKKD